MARLEATEGAITRVGTNIYSAPEHNPLVQTGSLDLGAIVLGREHITPAADIYSLAKTSYALLAGESPRRFAQHAIGELPAGVRNHYWSNPVLRVLEKATQIRPDKRYQNVQEFWDDFADAALPPTRPLQTPASDASIAAQRKPSVDLTIEPEEFTEAPPQPRFQPVSAPPVLTSGHYADVAATKRPKIVVPVSALRIATRGNEVQQTAKQRLAVMPDEPRKGKLSGGKASSGKVLPERLVNRRRPVTSRRTRPYLVAAILILAFSFMLLATHKYVTSHWNPFVGLPLLADIFVIGREGVTTADVHLRLDASVAKPAIGVAEAGSRIKVLATAENWYEVQVLEHGRAKSDPFTSDRGWINKKFVKFD